MSLGSTTIGKLGFPRDLASDAARFSKRSLTTTTAGTPFSSRVIASWTLHVVHEPQWPMPTTTASHRRASSSMVSCGVPLDAEGLGRMTASRASYFSTARSP